MTLYIITHTNQDGELHRLGGTCAETPEAAIAQMLADANSEDDGKWLAHIIIDTRDVTVLKWMVGTNLLLTLGVLWKVLTL